MTSSWGAARVPTIALALTSGGASGRAVRRLVDRLPTCGRPVRSSSSAMKRGARTRRPRPRAWRCDCAHRAHRHAPPYAVVFGNRCSSISASIPLHVERAASRRPPRALRARQLRAWALELVLDNPPTPCASRGSISWKPALRLRRPDLTTTSCDSPAARSASFGAVSRVRHRRPRCGARASRPTCRWRTDAVAAHRAILFPLKPRMRRAARSGSTALAARCAQSTSRRRAFGAGSKSSRLPKARAAQLGRGIDPDGPPPPRGTSCGVSRQVRRWLTMYHDQGLIAIGCWASSATSRLGASVPDLHAGDYGTGTTSRNGTKRRMTRHAAARGGDGAAGVIRFLSRSAETQRGGVVSASRRLFDRRGQAGGCLRASRSPPGTYVDGATSPRQNGAAETAPIGSRPLNRRPRSSESAQRRVIPRA